MKRKGWKEGSGLGVRESGISEPLDVEGQHPTCKKGLGYVHVDYTFYFKFLCAVYVSVLCVYNNLCTCISDIEVTSF